MSKRTMKKGLVLFLVLMLAVLSAACGNSKKDKAEGTTEVKQSNPDYVKKGVTLPKDFGNMIYPMESVLVQNYAKGLHYYSEEYADDEADSFWFTMAVLTSQMNHYVKDVAVKTDDHFIYIDDDTVNMYASGLYDEFGKGNMEFPDIGEDNPYAAYDDEKEIYGFREGTIGDLEPYISECKKKGDGYVFTMHLKNKESGKVVRSGQITIVPTSYESEDNAFAYSVQSFKKLSAKDLKKASEKDKSKKKDSDEDAKEETTEEKDDDDQDDSGSSKVSKDKALKLAKEYFGEDAQYKYKKTVTIGDEDYYDFSVKGDGISSSDVLVSVSGEIVMGGNRNNDGTWSFDQ